MATPTTQGSASVEECEDYIEKHGIQGLLKECIAKICQERPANPYKWLSEYFDTLDHKNKKVGLDPLYAAVYVWAACGRRGRSSACVCVCVRACFSFFTWSPKGKWEHTNYYKCVMISYHVRTVPV